MLLSGIYPIGSPIGSLGDEGPFMRWALNISEVFKTFHIAWRSSMNIRLLLCFTLVVSASSQTFVRVTDPSNPIVTQSGTGAVGYAGAAWVDYNSDGNIDLFVCPDRFYKNNGNGSFSTIQNHGIGAGLPHAPANGVTWADMDNDGDPDCFYSGPRSVLYRNNGADSNFSFTPMTEGEIGSINNRGWASAWGEIDNDGFVDLIITHPQGFVGTAIVNPFFRNLGGGEFERITTGDVVKNLAPYTVATWYDHDLDGDQDLFIGSGPATAIPAKDYLFKNILKETGNPGLQRITTGAIATDEVDGQVWNWIDYDNDGDLDAYLTNYAGVAQNNLYRNDAGTYVKMSAAQAGPIVSANNSSLSNIWIDFDNDGDLDCFITRDGNNKCVYYSNNGAGMFLKIDTIPQVQTAAQHIAAVAGDYDNDGDMDLFVVNGTGTHELYRNDQPAANSWIKVNVSGFPLNRSAIGAKVKVKATVNGKSYWQMREISAQNSFNGHNTPVAHIGLGNAALIDSLVVEWLSGSKTVMTNVAVKQSLNITENGDPAFLRSLFAADKLLDQVPFIAKFSDKSFGGTGSVISSWKWDLNGDGVTDATIKDPTFNYTVPDSYSVRLIVSDGVKSDTLVRKDYIIAQKAAPLINFNTTQVNLGLIDVNVPKKDTVLKLYNKGKGFDSISVSLVYGATSFSTVKPDSAIIITPRNFVLMPNDSQSIAYTLFPGRVIRTLPSITYTPKIVVTSWNNGSPLKLEKSMVFQLTGTIADVEDNSSLPSDYALFQNFPNPFNPGTTIRFNTPQSGHVSLKLYDSIGREVMTMIDEDRPAGAYSYLLNAEHLSSGLYFYILDAESFRKTKQLLLVK